MPPPLTLLLCTAFVLFLLRLESRVSRGLSTALWIPTVWILMIASRSLGAWFGMTGDNESGSSLDRLVLSGLTVAGIVMLARRRFNWSGALRRHRWLLALLAYMFVSTLWSDNTLVALKRCVREVIVVVMALVTMSEADPRQALASLLRRSAYVLVPFSLVLIKYYPTLGRQYGRWSGVEMWSGVAGQKNMLGRLCMISVLFLLWSLHQRWRNRAAVGGRYQGWADVSVILTALYLLKGADSSTSLATLIVGVATFLGLRLFRKLKLMVPQVGLLALVIVLLGFGVSAPFLGGSNVAAFSSSLGRDATLTGRTEVWAALLPVLKQQLLLGYGFGSFWTDARRELYDIPTAHSGYLDILLELGAVGLALYTVWLLSCARQLHRALAQDYDWASIAICFLIMCLVYNVTESALNSLTEHMTAVVVLASLVVPYKLDRGGRQRRHRARTGTAAWFRAELRVDGTCSIEPERSGPEVTAGGGDVTYQVGRHQRTPERELTLGVSDAV
jgi:exopolysaccharide production protein ExoQ